MGRGGLFAGNGGSGMDAGQCLYVLAVAAIGVAAQEFFSGIARAPDVARLDQRVDAVRGHELRGAGRPHVRRRRAARAGAPWAVARRWPGARRRRGCAATAGCGGASGGRFAAVDTGGSGAAARRVRAHASAVTARTATKPASKANRPNRIDVVVCTTGRSASRAARSTMCEVSDRSRHASADRRRPPDSRRARPAWPPRPASRETRTRSRRRSSRPGTTRRLLSISSVSVRRKNAPISAIQFVAGRPMRVPQAARSAAMNSRCGSGIRRGEFTGPLRSSRSIRSSTARTKSRVVDPRHELPPAGDRPAQAAPRQAEQHVEDAAAVRAHHHRRAQRDLAGRGVAASRLRPLPRLGDVDAELPVRGHVGLVAADEAGRLVVGRVEAVGVDGRRAHLQPDARRPLGARDGLADHARRVDARAHHLREVGVRVAAVDAAAGEIDDDVGAVELARPRPDRAPVPGAPCARASPPRG